VRDNTSVGSKAFFMASPMSACSNLTIEGNTILDCQDTAVLMQDMGPLLLFDNLFAGRTNPTVKVNAKAAFVCVGNTFTAANAVQGRDSDINFDNKLVDYDALHVTVAEPPGPLPKQERPTISLRRPAPRPTFSKLSRRRARWRASGRSSTCRQAHTRSTRRP
jgi:hypothetical protein